MSDKEYPENTILSFSLILSKLGLEGEVEAIPLEKIKQAFVDEGWHDADFIAKYEQAYHSVYDLYEALEGYGK